MRLYETVFIISPELNDDDVKECSGRIEELITKYKGEIVTVENWGKKRLAYEVKRQRYGTYILIHFKGTSELLKELERTYKMSETIIKYIIITISEKQLASLKKLQRPIGEEEYSDDRDRDRDRDEDM